MQPQVSSGILDKLRQSRHVLMAPVFNDYACARRLVEELAGALPEAVRAEGCLLLIDDGSTEPPLSFSDCNSGGLSLLLMRLRTNLGHQRAIAVGIGFVSSILHPEATLVVLDADGEDAPSDVPRLIATAREHPLSIVVANRLERSESRGFRVGYGLYRALYRLLTGHGIRHGNFCAMRGRIASRIAHAPSLWNHFAATLFKSRLPIMGVDVRRGSRYVGHGRMNFIQLMTHGLSAIAVHMETAAARMLIASIALTLAALGASLAVVVIRLLTPWAIPGWASVVSLLFFLLAVIGLLTSTTLVFSVLSSRDRRPVVAAVDTTCFIESIEPLVVTP